MLKTIREALRGSRERTAAELRAAEREAAGTLREAEARIQEIKEKDRPEALIEGSDDDVRKLTTEIESLELTAERMREACRRLSGEIRNADEREVITRAKRAARELPDLLDEHARRVAEVSQAEARAWDARKVARVAAEDLAKVLRSRKRGHADLRVSQHLIERCADEIEVEMPGVKPPRPAPRVIDVAAPRPSRIEVGTRSRPAR